MEKDRSLEILDAILMINNRLGKMEERFDKIEKQVEINHIETKEQLVKVHDKLDMIERKMGQIPPTYQVNEKILGNVMMDVELLKKIVLTQ